MHVNIPQVNLSELTAHLPMQVGSSELHSPIDVSPALSHVMGVALDKPNPALQENVHVVP